MGTALSVCHKPVAASVRRRLARLSDQALCKAEVQQTEPGSPARLQAVQAVVANTNPRVARRFMDWVRDCRQELGLPVHVTN